jgi:hypothetical protein
MGAIPFPLLNALLSRRRKVFVSYYHDDENEVQQFISFFDDTHDSLIARGIGAGMPADPIDSTDDEYVLDCIKRDHLKDSTVTVVMVGNCTWARKFVDWEIQASLRNGDTVTPNGLLAIKLPSYRSGRLPDRLRQNVPVASPGLGPTSILIDLIAREPCYGRLIDYPKNLEEFWRAIEDAFSARTTRQHLINNPRERLMLNLNCGHLRHFWY